MIPSLSLRDEKQSIHSNVNNLEQQLQARFQD